MLVRPDRARDVLCCRYQRLGNAPGIKSLVRVDLGIRKLLKMGSDTYFGTLECHESFRFLSSKVLTTRLINSPVAK